MNELLRYVRAIAPTAESADVADRTLLNRFVEDRNESAFAVLVSRYGGSVWSVCRRNVDGEHDAEEVFQATFLTLARKAGSIRGSSSLPAWLHGVARRIAANLRRNARRQHAVVAKAADLARSPSTDLTWREGLTILDEELARLPQRYRAVLIACCLEDRPRDEAAAHLGWTEAQVKGRLERARSALHQQLEKRGICLAAVLLAVAVPPSASVGSASLAMVPLAVLARAVQVAATRVSGYHGVAGAISPQVTSLTEGALRAMFLQKIKFAAGTLLAGAFLGGSIPAINDETIGL